LKFTFTGVKPKKRLWTHLIFMSLVFAIVVFSCSAYWLQAEMRKSISFSLPRCFVIAS